jgi:hypothetical protein
MLSNSILTLTGFSITTIVAKVFNYLSLAFLKKLSASNLLYVIILLLSKLVLIYVKRLKYNNL